MSLFGPRFAFSSCGRLCKVTVWATHDAETNFRAYFTHAIQILALYQQAFKEMPTASRARCGAALSWEALSYVNFESYIVLL